MSEMENGKLDRRSFIKLSAVGLTAATAGVAWTRQESKSSAAIEEQQEAESTHSWAMVIDQAKCVGCEQCVLACKAQNDIAPDIAWSRVNLVKPVGKKEVYLPVQCMHCEEAPCVDICPVGASYYRPDGIVMMDYDRCIGCRYCEMACPYGARSFNWQDFVGENPVVPAWGQPDVARRPRGVVEKCTFCAQRIDRGLEFGLVPGVDAAATPACVVACPQKARTFGDLNDPDSAVSKLLANHASYRLREDLGTGPRIYYLPAVTPHHEVEDQA
ncbi:MAG: sulfate reduction electron transfer complex DsrMKJOP subunit DsrO [Candidatus Promineifilaceae bacterium]|jgi:Fe-S-cluster-containing dehydrogenase component